LLMMLVTTYAGAQEWRDYKLTWNASEYDGVSSVTVPATLVWTPDVVLYNRCA